MKKKKAKLSNSKDLKAPKQSCGDLQKVYFPCEGATCVTCPLLLHKYAHVFKSCILLVVLVLNQIFVRSLRYLEHLLHSSIFRANILFYAVVGSLYLLFMIKMKFLTMKIIGIFIQN